MKRYVRTWLTGLRTYVQWLLCAHLSFSLFNNLLTELIILFIYWFMYSLISWLIFLFFHFFIFLFFYFFIFLFFYFFITKNIFTSNNKYCFNWLVPEQPHTTFHCCTHYLARSVLQRFCGTCRPSIFLSHGPWVKIPSKKIRYVHYVHTLAVYLTFIVHTVSVRASYKHRTFRNIITVRTPYVRPRSHLTYIPQSATFAPISQGIVNQPNQQTSPLHTSKPVVSNILTSRTLYLENQNIWDYGLAIV